MFGQKPKLDSIEFANDQWQVLEESVTHRTYSPGNSEVVRFAFNRSAPEWPFDLTSLADAQAFYGNMSAELGGAMLSLDIEQHSNAEVLNGVFKYRSPEPGSLAMYFVGMSIIPFRKFNYQINVECVEAGTTGMREAAVFAQLLVQGARPDKLDSAPEELQSTDDFASKVRNSKVRVVPSDDPKYDSGFPNHPLTVVRDTQFHILDSLVIPDWILAKPKHRR